MGLIRQRRTFADLNKNYARLCHCITFHLYPPYAKIPGLFGAVKYITVMHGKDEVEVTVLEE